MLDQLPSIAEKLGETGELRRFLLRMKFVDICLIRGPPVSAELDTIQFAAESYPDFFNESIYALAPNLFARWDIDVLREKKFVVFAPILRAVLGEHLGGCVRSGDGH